jgi:hypothetical protein
MLCLRGGRGGVRGEGLETGVEDEAVFRERSNNEDTARGWKAVGRDRDQARPASAETYRLPALSATASAEALVAMQPVSALPLIHLGRPAPTGTSGPCPSTDRR